MEKHRSVDPNKKKRLCSYKTRKKNHYKYVKEAVKVSGGENEKQKHISNKVFVGCHAVGGHA